MADAVEAALSCYNWLASEALQQRKKLWKVVPKLHMLTHIAYDNAQEVNPRWVHCYGDEDMVGKVKRIANKCHGATAHNAVLLRYLIWVGIRWWQELHLLRGWELDYGE